MVTLTAEIGLNHEGNWDLAYELIRQAKLCGADIAKFQVGWRHAPGELNHITPEIARKLRDWCDFWEIEFMASIIDPEVLDIVAEVNPRRLKVASRTVTEHPDMVKRLLDSGKEMYVSLGWWDGDDWPFGPPDDQLRYIYCISQYPTYPAGLAEMPKTYGRDSYWGYSDHTHGIETCLLAVAHGARFIEKHFTLDKTLRTVHGDHIFSATPDELRLLHDVGHPLAKLAAVMHHGESGVSSVPIANPLTKSVKPTT